MSNDDKTYPPEPPTVLRAFPGVLSQGMTLRDYFAAAALTGLVASPHMTEWSPANEATSAYQLADAMMLERGKE